MAFVFAEIAASTFGRIDVQRVGVDVDEHGAGAGLDDRLGRGVEGERGGDDLVALADAGRAQGDGQAVGAVGDADGPGGAEVGGRLLLEGLDVGAQDVAPSAQDVEHRPLDLLADLGVLALDVHQPDRHVFTLPARPSRRRRRGPPASPRDSRPNRENLPQARRRGHSLEERCRRWPGTGRRPPGRRHAPARLRPRAHGVGYTRELPRRHAGAVLHARHQHVRSARRLRAHGARERLHTGAQRGHHALRRLLRERAADGLLGGRERGRRRQRGRLLDRLRRRATTEAGRSSTTGGATSFSILARSTWHIAGSSATAPSPSSSAACCPSCAPSSLSRRASPACRSGASPSTRVLGCVPWVIMLTFVGTKVGANWEKIQKQLHYLDYAVVAAIVALVVWAVLRRRRGASARLAGSDPE